MANSTSAAARAALLRRARLEHLLPEEVHELGESGLGVHGRIVHRRGPHPEERGHRDHLDVDIGPLQVTAVELDDAPPLGVEVDLGDHAEQPGAAFERQPHEAQLGQGQLLGGVGHEQHRVGQAEHAQREVALGRLEPAHPGRVDEREPGAEHPPVEPDLDRPDAGALTVARRVADIVADLLERDLGVLRLARAGRLPMDDHPGRIPEPDDRRDGGDDVVVDRADLGGQDGVDQRALALLVLAHDDDGQVALGHGRPGRVEPLDQVLAPAGRGRLAGAQQLELDPLAGIQVGRLGRWRIPRGVRRLCGHRCRMRGGTGDVHPLAGAPVQEGITLCTKGQSLGVAVAAPLAHDHRVDIRRWPSPRHSRLRQTLTKAPITNRRA